MKRNIVDLNVATTEHFKHIQICYVIKLSENVFPIISKRGNKTKEGETDGDDEENERGKEVESMEEERDRTVERESIDGKGEEKESYRNVDGLITEKDKNNGKDQRWR